MPPLQGRQRDVAAPYVAVLTFVVGKSNVPVVHLDLTDSLFEVLVVGKSNVPGVDLGPNG